MIIYSEAEMLEFGRQFASCLVLPAIIELVGDVGMGKTTFTRGLATGLGVEEAVTSPSFTISKRYHFPLSQKCCKNYNTSSNTSNATFSKASDNTPQYGELVHYDFYRLDDPGIMRDELSETLAKPYTVSVIEWGNSIADLLPVTKYQITITMQEDGSRAVEVAHADEGGELSL